MFRVTYFSAFRIPQHFENLTNEEANEILTQGKEQQYKCVVTDMDEPEPTNMNQEYPYNFVRKINP